VVDDAYVRSSEAAVELLAHIGDRPRAYAVREAGLAAAGVGRSCCTVVAAPETATASQGRIMTVCSRRALAPMPDS
jgi:hypothetical protein